MSSYIPFLTLPNMLFEQPVAAVLMPIAMGTAVGFSNKREFYSFLAKQLTKGPPASATQAKYMALKQPPLRPPPQVFGPVWTTLYGAMGYAAYRAWSTGMSSLNPRTVELTKQGATLYTIQLGLNLIWMPLFFKFKRPVAASVDILALTSVVAGMTYIWGQVDKVAAYTLAPYLVWLGFATYLTVSCAISYK